MPSHNPFPSLEQEKSEETRFLIFDNGTCICGSSEGKSDLKRLINFLLHTETPNIHSPAFGQRIPCVCCVAIIKVAPHLTKEDVNNKMVKLMDNLLVVPVEREKLLKYELVMHTDDDADLHEMAEMFFSAAPDESRMTVSAVIFDTLGLPPPEATVISRGEWETPSDQTIELLCVQDLQRCGRTQVDRGAMDEFDFHVNNCTFFADITTLIDKPTKL
ncbi:hypothetical protein B0H19DRAFT_1068850 [Mycena capillaripes]|nr:hypothetical protein B0H19DRAFT_1068850 [Mycena capillaripes]